jgi:diguanylate cyclase (GGDEF)-like protein/hemerythrin-like metal-binding protein/PAS domain S-box-containing protein
VDAIDIFPWDDHFNTGLAEIDAQHRRLVALLNRLASQVAGGADALVLNGIFDELADYTVYHFNTEEAVWRTYLAGDPAEIGHRATHDAFRRDVARLKAALGQTASHQVAEEALGFLARWLASHILEADRSLACIVRALQRGLSPEAARQQARDEMGGTTRALIDLILSIYATLSTNTLRLMRELAEHRQAAADLEIARTALSRERIQLHTLINTLPDLIWLKDPDGVYLSCNARFEQLYGVPEARIIGRTDHDFVDTEQANFFRQHDLAAIERGGPSINEEEVTFADGHHELLETTKTPMHDSDGRLIGVLGIGHNIGHLKQAEEALRRIENEQRSLINALPDIIMRFDAAGTHLFVSENVRTAVPMDARQFIGKTHRELGFPQDLCDFWEQSIHRCFESRQPFETDFTLDAPSGTRTFNWRLQPDLDGAGQVRTVLAIARDITERKAIEAALKASEARASTLYQLLRGIADNVPDMIWAKDLNKHYLFANRALCAGLLNATDPEEPVGRDDMYFALRERTAHSDNPNWHTFGELCQDSDTVTLQRGVPSQFDEYGNVQGKFLFLDVRKAPFIDENGQVIGVVGSGRDVTAQKAIEAKLRLADLVMRNSSEAMFVTDANDLILEVNAAFTTLTGYSADESVGRTPATLLKSGEQADSFYHGMWRQLAETGRWQGEIWNRRKDGTLYAEWLTVDTVFDASGAVHRRVAMFTDITERKQHQHQLEQLAHYDPLTGLPNRVLLADRLRQAMAQSHRHHQVLALAFIDLDDFKSINDRHGHDAGDQLLTVIAERMTAALRESDTLARIGGDEFVAVLGDLSDPQASVPWVQRLLEATSQPIAYQSETLQISCSIGIAFHAPGDTRDADQLLREADHAMYQAKQAGRNRYHVFDAEQDRALRCHHDSIERIRQALERREFVLHYQPKVHMRSGQVLGAEALIRWQHPQLGLLGPSAFLPEIEHDALGIPLGEWVIESALTQLERWQDAGLHLPISVNIAANHLQQGDFVERLHALLARHPAVPPGALELEVLETSALADIDRMSSMIAECARLGVTFALDDFGTGYSSLTYLKRLPARTLKIDQSFVRDMLVDPDDLAILEGVLGMATAFRRQTIAEGVETEAHGLKLLALGCEWGQGFGIARPMPADDLAEWVAHWQPPTPWQTRFPIAREDLPLLYAKVELRAWCMALETHLRTGGEPPALDPHECRFGLWLDTLAGAHDERQALFRRLDPLHRQVHDQGRRLVELHARGIPLEQLTQPMTALCHQRDELLALMDQLMES